MNVVTLPVAVGKDVITLGGTMTSGHSAIMEHLDKIKRDSE